eukprot:3680400-Rhodomonas_salina.1
MPSAHIAHDAICLRACYAMSGSEIAQGPARSDGKERVQLPFLRAIVLRVCYAMSGTETGNLAPNVDDALESMRVPSPLCSYALATQCADTELGYDPTAVLCAVRY